MNFLFSLSFFFLFYFQLMLQVAMLNSLIVFLFAYFLRIDRDISLWFSSGLVCIFSNNAFKRGVFFLLFVVLLLLHVAVVVCPVLH